jgi:hypothetical protein
MMFAKKIPIVEKPPEENRLVDFTLPVRRRICLLVADGRRDEASRLLAGLSKTIKTAEKKENV